MDAPLDAAQVADDEPSADAAAPLAAAQLDLRYKVLDSYGCAQALSAEIIQSLDVLYGAFGQVYLPTCVAWARKFVIPLAKASYVRFAQYDEDGILKRAYEIIQKLCRRDGAEIKPEMRNFIGTTKRAVRDIMAEDRNTRIVEGVVLRESQTYVMYDAQPVHRKRRRGSSRRRFSDPDRVEAEGKDDSNAADVSAGSSDSDVSAG